MSCSICFRRFRAIRLITSRIADACIEGKELYEERQQARIDKASQEESGLEAVAEELKPGERKVISDGTDGPIVEIIRKSATEDITSASETPVEEQGEAAQDTGE